ncbi:Alpha/beta hydrolase family protein [Marinobacter daqiaonensis]|uniref:Alpha/beta hydrolase family protein n=1 Tax=Marinobacter daqiaonensis TaxID=650891 RepID=A0A1I6IDL6_9GAMM|nr:alpha/beta fold hydrolase [Marinobacter daqiaonensis]SFR64791.1 Alpha/beta hydrolase family protein [Marinobacter daqiaonensis]
MNLIELKARVLLFALMSIAALPLSGATGDGRQPVVLLHGLIRSDASMEDMARALNDAGFRPCNVDYPSTEHPIGELAMDFVLPAIQDCVSDPEETPIAFVGHSLGAIIVRYLGAEGAPIRFGRVVMLAPPNKGSVMVDKLKDNELFQWLNGPAGSQLGTGENSLPRSLGATELEVGVIAGTGSINPVFSALIPGEDDGTVAVDNTRLEGMDDFIEVPASHSFMMYDDEVIAQTVHFLKTGAFRHDQ